MTTGSNLDRRITIERYTEVSDGHGGFDQIWAKLATVAASRKDVSDGERFAYSRIVADTVRRFVIRAIGPQATVTGTDRVRYDGATWNIIGVKETSDGRKRFLEIAVQSEE